MMNALENFRRICAFDSPEWVMSGPPTFQLGYYGCNHEGFETAGVGDEHPTGSRWTDVWGTGWHKVHADVMGMPEICPLADPAALKTYRWPNPDDERICAQIYQRAKDFPGGDLLLGGSHRDTLWEKAYMLVGMENMMVYFHSEPEYAADILHHIMDFQLGISRHYLAAGVQYVFLGDDLGTQQGPLLGPRIVNRFLVPEYRRLFDLYRQHGQTIEFHSCGKIDSMLETFIDLGVNILNPVQASANDLTALRAATQGRLTLHGGVSSAVIMDGPIEAIQAEVRTRLWQLGQAGGYLCDPDQGMPYPPHHLQAVSRAVEQYGVYPLQPFA